MKGLLLKDFYLFWRYCRSFLLICLAFAGASVFSENFFFVYYPSLLMGILPMTLQAYDEREKWTVYSGTLPYTKAQLVSAKYLMGVILVGLTTVFMVIGAQGLRMILMGPVLLDDIIYVSVFMLAVGLASPALTMPFVFRFGTEKARLAYYCIVGVICATGTIASIDSDISVSLNGPTGLLLVGAAAAVLYALSWMLSIHFYENREL